MSEIKIMINIKSKCQINKAPAQVLKFIIYELVRQLDEVRSDLGDVQEELNSVLEYWKEHGCTKCGECGDWIDSNGNICVICEHNFCNDGRWGSDRCPSELKQCSKCKRYYCNDCGKFEYHHRDIFWTCKSCLFNTTTRIDDK